MIADKLYSFIWKCIQKSDSKRLAKMSKDFSNVSVCENIKYGDDEKNKFDIFMPKHNLVGNKIPVIINIHGGGYVYGNKELNTQQSVALAKSGFCVFNIDYTLVDKVKDFSYSLKDVFKFFNYFESIQNEKLDKDNVFITGDSSGAHLASLATLITKNDDMMEEFNLSSKINIKACAFTCPVFHVFKFRGLPILHDYKRLILGKNWKKYNLAEKTNFTKRANASMPPILIISASKDIFLSEAKNLLKKAKEKGLVVIQSLFSKGKNNKHCFNVMNPHESNSIEANKKIIDFFLMHTKTNDIEKELQTIAKETNKRKGNFLINTKSRLNCVEREK